MRAPPLLALVAVLCPVLAPSSAAADEVEAQFGASLELGPTTIEVELTRFEARYTVRYEVRNPGVQPDEARVYLDLPATAAVTGMRYQPRAGAAWLDARILPAGDASARWERYLEAPFAAHRGPALIEQQGDMPVLRLLYVPAGDRVAVEYSLIAPVCRAAEHWFAPARNIESGVSTIEVIDNARYVVRGPRSAGRRVSRAEAAAIAGQDIDMACAATDPIDAWRSDHFLVAKAPEIPDTRGVESRLVMVPAGEARVVEVIVDTGARLSPIPHDASVVFVIDASISMGEVGVAAQLAMVKAYLARSPGARFEIVVYRRHAALVFRRWRAGADAARAIDEAGDAAFALGNGSSLDAGLTLAASLLARAPGPRRLVAFTDDEVREALDQEVARLALAGLPTDAVVHVVLTNGDGDTEHSSLERDDAHWLAPVAAHWGGMAVWGYLGPDDETARSRNDAFEELVRPRRIDNVVVEEGNGEREELDAIAEGESVRTVLVTENDAVTVHGMIWGRPWQPPLVTGERVQRRVAALAVGEGLVSGLDDDALRAFATFAGVVSDATSLWADDPRWKPGGLPPEVGLHDRDEIGSFSTCSARCSITGGSRHVGVGHVGAAGAQPDLAALLAGPVATCALGYGQTSWNVSLEIETTGREIVDVRLIGGADHAAFASCVIESGWSLALGEEYEKWTASFEVNILGDSSRR